MQSSEKFYVLHIQNLIPINLTVNFYLFGAVKAKKNPNYHSFGIGFIWCNQCTTILKNGCFFSFADAFNITSTIWALCGYRCQFTYSIEKKNNKTSELRTLDSISLTYLRHALCIRVYFILFIYTTFLLKPKIYKQFFGKIIWSNVTNSIESNAEK